MVCDLADEHRIPHPDTLDPADALFHFAADVSVSSPTLRAANVDGTSRALALADALAIPYVVYASSIEAQGLGSESRNSSSGRHGVPSGFGLWTVESSGGRARDRVGIVAGPSGSGASHRQHLWTRERLVSPSFPVGLAGRHADSDDLDDSSGIVCFSRSSSTTSSKVFVDAVDRRLAGTYNMTGEEQVTIEGYLAKLASLTQLTDRIQLMRVPAAPSGRSLPIAPDFAYVLMGTQEQCHRAYDNSRLRAEIGPYARWSLSRGLAATLQWYDTSGQLPALLAALRRQPGAMTCM